jgi:hypothetical protein
MHICCLFVLSVSTLTELYEQVLLRTIMKKGLKVL